MSGIVLKKGEYPQYTEEEIARHFALFNQYDVDSTGFISKENLLECLQAMSIEGASLAMATTIIDEVAVLCGHDNDGRLSFRDYMHAIEYDKQAALHNLALDAAAEQPLPCDEEPVGANPEAPAEQPEEQPQGRARHSSLSVVHSLASSRIAAFQQVVNDARVAAKIEAFKTTPLEASVMVNSDEIMRETLANKIKAFEVAAKFTGKVALKKTWRQAHGAHGNYTPGQKIMIGDKPAKPPPRKKLSELP